MYFKRMLNINIPRVFCFSFLNADLNELDIRIFHSVFSVRSYERLLGRTKNTEEQKMNIKVDPIFRNKTSKNKKIKNCFTLGSRFKEDNHKRYQKRAQH